MEKRKVGAFVISNPSARPQPQSRSCNQAGFFQSKHLARFQCEVFFIRSTRSLVLFDGIEGEIELPSFELDSLVDGNAGFEDRLRQRCRDCKRVALDILLRSEENTSELQSLMRISYAVFCLNKKKYKLY